MNHYTDSYIFVSHLLAFRPIHILEYSWLLVNSQSLDGEMPTISTKLSIYIELSHQNWSTAKFDLADQFWWDFCHKNWSPCAINGLGSQVKQLACVCGGGGEAQEKQ